MLTKQAIKLITIFIIKEFPLKINNFDLIYRKSHEVCYTWKKWISKKFLKNMIFYLNIINNQQFKWIRQWQEVFLEEEGWYALVKYHRIQAFKMSQSLIRI